MNCEATYPAFLYTFYSFLGNEKNPLFSILPVEQQGVEVGEHLRGCQKGEICEVTYSASLYTFYLFLGNKKNPLFSILPAEQQGVEVGEHLRGGQKGEICEARAEACRALHRAWKSN